MEMNIDFVVTWLDNNDPKWKEEFATYSPQSTSGKANARFRDQNLFKYWFRAVEMYAPWVHKVFLITNGKFPDWININNPKLELVKHEDYMPKECLPTFNSCAIELHMHRIKGLSEHFVYFNDDMILNAPVGSQYYFRNGLPCDMNKETYYNVPIYTKTDRFGIYLQMLADIGIINANFNRKKTVRQSPKRWFGSHLGIRGILMSFMLLQRRLFIGFSNYHIEQAYLKSVFDEVWKAAPEFMNASCTRFREDTNSLPYIYRYWQLASNRFVPIKRKGAFFFIIKKGIVDKIEKALYNPAIKSICFNDNALCEEEDFEYISTRLEELLEKKFPQRSSFEI